MDDGTMQTPTVISPFLGAFNTLDSGPTAVVDRLGTVAVTLSFEDGPASIMLFRPAAEDGFYDCAL